MGLLKQTYNYLEAGVCSTAIAVVATRAAEHIIIAANPPRVVDLLSTPHWTSLIGAFAGVAIGNQDAQSNSWRPIFYTGIACYAGILGGTIAEGNLSAYIGAFASACAGLCMRQTLGVPEPTVTLHNDLDY